MSSDILGTYDFANHYGINHKVDNKLAAQTIVHEMYHMRFTLCSPYGNFIQLNTRLCVIDGRFSYVNNFLLEHSLKMQEAVCTFSEVILLVTSRSFSSANEYICSLRDDNKEYYNYVRPLLPLLDFITENDAAVATAKIPAKKMFSIVGSLVSIAMDVDLTQISVDIFRSAKQLKAFSSIEGVSEKFFPNKRFFSSIRALIDIFKTGADKAAIHKRISEELLASALKCSKEHLQLAVEKNKRHLRSLYADSPHFEVIAENLDKAVVKEVDPIDLIGSGIPNSYNTQYPIGDIKDLSELSDIFSHDIGIIFFLGDLKQLVSESNRFFYVPPEGRNIEHNLLAVTLLNFTRKEQYGCCCSPGEAADICGGIDIPIVVNYKAYGPHKSFLQSFGRPLYIYCDRSYINAIEIIKNYTADTKRYSIISYDDHVGGLSLLIIELEKNVYFFLPMVSISEVNLLTDIEAGRLNLQRTLIIDDALLEQFDTIMNSIFYY